MVKALFLTSILLLMILRFISAENVTDSAEETLNFVNNALNKLKITNNPNIILVMVLPAVGNRH